jgi:tetratricopeptide (TPR) repeat protein
LIQQLPALNFRKMRSQSSNITTMNKILFSVLALSISTAMLGQNTIGGIKTSVPESEVKRQSAFLTAERERILAHWDKALEAYKTFLFENPEYDAAWYGLSRTYAATNDLVNALDAIAKAVAKDPNNQWYLLYQADLFERIGRNKDALATYEILVKRFPETSEFYEKLAYLAVLNNDPKRGLKALEKLEQFEGITEDNIAKKHLIYLGLNDRKKAAGEYRKLSDAYPNTVRYRYQLADFYQQIGDQANAQKTWEEIARRFPNDPLASRALATQQTGTDTEYLSSIRPLLADPRVDMDTKIKKIIPFLSKIEGNKDPAFSTTFQELGAILEKTHPEDAKAWSISGDILYLSNKGTDALDRYRRCLQLNQGIYSVWENTLLLLLEQKNYVEVINMAEKALDFFPNQPQIYVQYALAAIALQQYDAALGQLSLAQSMSGNNAPWLAEILDLTGNAFLGKGDSEKAKKLWQKAFEITKSPAIQDKINRVQ